MTLYSKCLYYFFYFLLLLTMSIIWFTSEAQDLLNKQEEFLTMKWERYVEKKEQEWYLRNDEIVQLFNDWIPTELWNDQEFFIQLNNSGEIRLKTVSWYYLLSTLESFEDRLRILLA